MARGSRVLGGAGEIKKRLRIHAFGMAFVTSVVSLLASMGLLKWTDYGMGARYALAVGIAWCAYMIALGLWSGWILNPALGQRSSGSCSNSSDSSGAGDIAADIGDVAGRASRRSGNSGGASGKGGSWDSPPGGKGGMFDAGKGKGWDAAGAKNSFDGGHAPSGPNAAWGGAQSQEIQLASAISNSAQGSSSGGGLDFDLGSGSGDTFDNVGGAVGGLVEAASGSDGAAPVVIPIIVIGAALSVAFLCASGLMFWMFGTDVLLAVSQEVAIGSSMGIAAARAGREGHFLGWFGMALRKTVVPFSLMALLCFGLRAGAEKLAQGSKTLPEAVKTMIAMAQAAKAQKESAGK